jgi:hypothetical protein
MGTEQIIMFHYFKAKGFAFGTVKGGLLNEFSNILYANFTIEK